MYQSLNYELQDADGGIAVVIPSYRVTAHILDVIRRIGDEVSYIIVVDDCCPDGSGDLVEKTCTDPRVSVVRHAQNKGVGGAVVTGYRTALDLGAQIVVKVDGDGQMAPELIPHIIRPIVERTADYSKGNRFHSLYDVRSMPGKRLFGNAALSFMTKLSSGYWSLFDPTNGYTAIHVEALRRLELNNLSERYFFESDMLINLGNIRAVARDVPMSAHYADEVSGLKLGKIVGPFAFNHLRELIKRILYHYFLRDFSLASLQLVFGLLFMTFGVIFGGVEWWSSAHGGDVATSGTVMIAVLPIILGFQLLLSFFSYDIGNEPKNCLQNMFLRTSKTPPVWVKGAMAPPADTAAPTSPSPSGLPSSGEKSGKTVK